MINKLEAYQEFCISIFTNSFEARTAINNLKRLGECYGVNMKDVETELYTKSNIDTVVRDLWEKESNSSLFVRLTGNLGFHLSQLASCVYDDSTGLDIVETLGDMLSLLIIMDELERGELLWL